MDEALQHLRSLRGPIYQVPMIVFIGHISRTWFADYNTIGAVMEILRAEKMFQPVHTRPAGFDLLVQQIATYLGLVPFEVAPTGEDEVGRAVRDPVMLDGAAMVVAFPMETPDDGKRGPEHGWETAEPELAPMIKQMKLPVLSVRRDGTVRWIEN